MSDSYPPSQPDADPSRPGLPSGRSSAGSPPHPDDAPAGQISLEEMMQRLQRSGESRSGESRSGEGRSGRRRRSSSSSSSSGESGRSSSSSGSSRSRRESETHPDDQAPPTYRDAPRAALPPPRRALDPATLPARSSRFQEKSTLPARRKWWLWILIALALIAFAVWLGIRLMNRWRIEGEGFKVVAARRISEMAGRRVALSRFQKTDSTQLSNASLTLSPTHQDLLSTAVLSDLTADFSPGSMMADDWLIQSLRIRRADLAFLPGKVVDEAGLWQTAPLPVPRANRTSGGFRLSMNSDPEAIILESGRIDALNLSWPGPSNQPESLTGLMGNFRLLEGTTQMELTNGVLATADWDPIPVRQLNAELRGTTLKIIGARLGFTAEHEFRVTGQAELTPTGKVELKGDITPIQLRHLLPSVWVSAVNGSFETSNTQWVSHIGQGPAPSLTGSFRIRGLSLRGIPFVDKIANLLRKPDLSLMEFPNLTGDFDWNPKGLTLTNLSASGANDLLRLKGKIAVITGESVSGDLTFEANDAFFAGLPPDAPTLFSPGQDGYRTLSVQFTGQDPTLQDNIGIAKPVILINPPTVIEKPRLTLPPGIAPSTPTPAPAPAPAAAPRSNTPAPAPVFRPVVPIPTPPVPSDAELERSFNELIKR